MKQALAIPSILLLIPLCAKANHATLSIKENVCLVYNIRTRHTFRRDFTIADILWLKPQDIARFDSLIAPALHSLPTH